MRAGRLRHRVIVKSDPIIRTPDGDGGYTETLTTLGERWASIEPAAALDVERQAQVQIVGPVTHFIRCRYLPGVTVRAVVEFGARVFQVKGVQNVDERNRELVLACEERA